MESPLHDRIVLAGQPTKITLSMTECILLKGCMWAELARATQLPYDHAQ